MSKLNEGVLVDVINEDGKTGLRMYVSHETNEKGCYFLSLFQEKSCSTMTKEENYRLYENNLIRSYQESELKIAENKKENVSNDDIILGDLVEIQDLFNEVNTLRLYVVDIKKDEEGNNTYKLSYIKDIEKRIEQLEKTRSVLKSKKKNDEEFEKMLMISQLIATAQSDMIFCGSIFNEKTGDLFDPYFKRSELVLIRD